MKKWDIKEKERELAIRVIKNNIDSFRSRLYELAGPKYLSNEERENLK